MANARCPVCEGAGGWNAHTNKPQHPYIIDKNRTPMRDPVVVLCMFCLGNGFVKVE